MGAPQPSPAVVQKMRDALRAIIREAEQLDGDVFNAVDAAREAVALDEAESRTASTVDGPGGDRP